MKKGIRILLLALVLALAAAVAALVAGSASRTRHGVTCNEHLDIRLQDSSFVTEQEVRDCLTRRYGSWSGQRIDSLDLHRMEEILNGLTAVKRSEVWVTPDGMLHVRIVQRQAAARFETADGGFYSDAEGYIFPLQKSWEAPVRTLTGSIPLTLPKGYSGLAPSEQDQEWLKGMLALVHFISGSKVWNARIASISIEPGGEVVLGLYDGREKILFGGSDSIQEKFKLLDDYYTYIRPSKDPGYYKTVNLKYHGQIICRQK